MPERVLTTLAVIVLGAALAAPPAAAQHAEAAAPEPPARTLTPQQQKLRTCGGEWRAMKRDGNTHGVTWAQYRRDCLKR